MYSVKQIAKLGLLKAPDGTPYTSKNTVALLVRSKHKIKKVPRGYGYLLTEDDIRKLQNLINKRNGIWNQPLKK